TRNWQRYARQTTWPPNLNQPHSWLRPARRSTMAQPLAGSATPLRNMASRVPGKKSLQRLSSFKLSNKKERGSGADPLFFVAELINVKLPSPEGLAGWLQ